MEENNNEQKTILVVDDEEVQRKPMIEELQDEGYNVLVAVNGQEGLEMAFREEPDLILLDIVMPVMDGMTMLKELRQKNSWSKNVPVILLTNLSADQEGIIEGVTKDEPAYYLVKSDFTLEEVVEKVNERLSREA
ncbi:MAG: response regulator [Patescibacteria group bacterium]